MICPICGSETKVVGSRAVDNAVIRWRKCLLCGQSIFTEEIETTQRDWRLADNRYSNELKLKKTKKSNK